MTNPVLDNKVADALDVNVGAERDGAVDDRDVARLRPAPGGVAAAGVAVLSDVVQCTIHSLVHRLWIAGEIGTACRRS